MDFLKNNKRFSFKYNGKDAFSLSYQTIVSENENVLTTVYEFEDGLKITNIAKKYPEFDAYEWVNFIENTSDKNSGMISELWDCDATFPLKYQKPFEWKAQFPERESATKVYAPSGSSCKMAEFFTRCDSYRVTDHLQSGGPSAFFNPIRKYSATGGLSSANSNAPFFNVHKEGEGYIFAIGWTGQWNAEILRGENSVTFKSKIEDTNFYLMPNEKFRTSSVVIMPYKGDVISSHNKWRKLVKNHFSLIKPNEQAPFCASVWGGLTSDKVITRINTIKENNIPFEYIWMDAGWYGIDTKPTPNEFEGDWAKKTGDFRISPLIHPNGLKDVSKTIHDAGMKFLLWFEPERVVPTTPIVKEHPEYLLSKDTSASSDFLLNLGNPDAFSYCFEMLSNFIEELHIDCYRQDFNFMSLEYWRRNDTPDRMGITEIKHINGLYKLWDMLLQKFPYLIIDNCAGGGRRIDIETLRRSVPLWRSDYQCVANFDTESAQLQTLTFGNWMPYSGTATGRVYDEYRVRSSYSSALNMGYFYSDIETMYDAKENLDFCLKYAKEYLMIRPYLSEDMYPLTGFNYELENWCGTQYDRPSEKDGLIMVFRRENSPYETSCFNLRGINKNSQYLVKDIDGDEFTINGEELAEFKITIPEKRTAKLYLYKELQNL